MFSNKLRRFDQSNWVSTFRTKYFPYLTENCSDAFGYDFHYYDEEKQLNPFTSYSYFFEVKGHSSLPSRFILSRNEWAVAQSCSSSPNKKYIIIGVTIYPSPKIVYWLEDPVSMEREGELALNPIKYFVHFTQKKKRGLEEQEEQIEQNEKGACQLEGRAKIREVNQKKKQRN